LYTDKIHILSVYNYWFVT